MCTCYPGIRFASSRLRLLRNIKEAKPTRVRPTQRVVKPIGVAVVALAEAGGLDQRIGRGEAPQRGVIHPAIQRLA